MVAGPLGAREGGGHSSEIDGHGAYIPELADPVSAHEASTYTHEGKGNFRLRNVVPDLANPLTARMHKGINTTLDEGQTPIVEACFDETQVTHPENRSSSSPDTAGLAASAKPPAIALQRAVRRLTPTECERLQGFPDGYTEIPFRGRPVADTPRYRALGNSMAVTVMQWIGRRIEEVSK